MKNWLKNFGVAILAGLMTVFIIVWLAYTIFLLKYDPPLAGAYVATGTLILALVTSLLVGLTWLTIKKADQREKRDRKERLLNEIIEWASNVARSAIYRQTIEPHELWKTKLEYKYHKSKGKYIGEIVSSSFKELSDSFNDINNKLDELIEVTTEFTKKSMVRGKRLSDYETELVECANKLIIDIAKIKTKNIGKKEENMSKEGEATGSNEPTLKDIEEHLKRQDIQMVRTQWQWPFSLGVSAMAIGLAWIIATTPITQGDFKSGLFVFFAGLLIVLLSLFYWYRKKA